MCMYMYIYFGCEYIYSYILYHKEIDITQLYSIYSKYVNRKSFYFMHVWFLPQRP